MRTNERKALIIGAGIAGPIVAMFFKRAGIDAEIYETRSESESYTGWFLNLGGNGIEVLKTLRIEAPILAEGSTVPRMMVWSGNGKYLGAVRNGARAGLTESVLIKRGALQQYVHNAAMEQGILIHFGKRLRDIEIGSERTVTATFEDGTTASGNFLVGSDGIHSRTRQIINPGAPKPTYTGLISTGGFTNRLNLPPTPGTQHFIFGRQAFFGYHVGSTGEIYWFNNHRPDQEPGRTELTEIASEDWKQRLLDMHDGDLALIQHIIRSTEDGIGGYPIFDIPPQPVWYEGPVVLIGDAVHAVSSSSGQGASLAMEDAAVLAKCLQNRASLTQAFVTYEGLRRERAERMVQWARKLGGAKLLTNPIQVWFRDLLMPFFLKSFTNPAALDWIYDYKVDWSEKVVDWDMKVAA